MQRRTRFIIGLTLAAATLMMVYGAVSQKETKEETVAEMSEEALASTIVDACATADYRPFCYENEVPKLLATHSAAEAFEVVRLIRSKDTGYLFCHVLAHKIGENEVAKDPENWLDVLAASPADGLCSNGYAHGAIMARFAVATFDETQMNAALPDFTRACLEREGYTPTELQKAMCFHGLGHVLVHLTNADVPRALAACRTITEAPPGAPFRTQCLEGVYMQLFQPLEPEDLALLEQLPEPPTLPTIEPFCRTQSADEMEYATCWREAWPIFRESLISSEGIVSYCGHLTEPAYRQQCLISTYTIHARLNLQAPSTIASVCNALPEISQQGDCFARSSNAYLEEDSALIDEGVALCGAAGEPSAQNTCYEFLAEAATFNFHRDSDAYNTLCRLLPGRYQSTCWGT